MEKHEIAEPVMMIGTNGSPDYIVIAGRGDVALGIKPGPMYDGLKMNVPGTVFVSARLRSARVDGKAYTPPEESNGFSPNPPSLREAWPNVTWEKADDKRASTTIGALIRGNASKPGPEADAFVAKLKDGTVAGRLADYLFELIGEKHMLLSREELVHHLQTRVYDKIAAMLSKYLAVSQAVTDEMEEHIETFTMQAALLNKAFKKAKLHNPTADEEPGHDLD